MPKKQMTAGKWMLPVSSAAPVSSASTPTPIIAASPVNTGVASPLNMPPISHGGNMDALSYAIMTLNTNPYLIGLFMLLLNLGGRFLSLELTKKQEAFLQAAWLRPLLFFTVVFIATRNLVAAFWTTILFFFIIWVAANEHSPFCMIPSWCSPSAGPAV